ncbi:hypothetical protein [Nocardioides sp. TF02-7]|uniref:hypothetical protein n=1 Tax=Nocardioides sp. TF02-7 TaxID=2917724 RepID=UPI001F050822|nr:hypothetical protein [Nocardioides sp. TF02-7]UMG94506.1 hypothetical protein MF408_11360 [Nocardioides sp. TF02-7]
MDLDSDLPIRGEIRGSGVRRVSHGVGLTVRDDLDSTQEFHRELRAMLLVLPPDAVFTHVTGAKLLGWRLPALPEQTPYFAATRADRRPRRPGLICSRLTHDSDGSSVAGLPVEAPEEILLRCARDLGVLDLTILIDAALERGHLDPQKMEEILATGRPGVVRLRRAWKLADPKAQSAGETLLRVFHDVMDVSVESQYEIHDDEGRFLGRGDLRVVGTNLIHEYDGAGHRGKGQHRTDLRRERAWSTTAYRRNGFTLDDLLNHAAVVMHELDRLLDRPHRPARLARWHSLVEESLYSETGRTRVMNRWKRQMGVVEWSRSAGRGG